MKIVVDTDVFANHASTIELDAIAVFALLGRHRIAVQDDRAGAYATWLQSLDKVHRERWMAVIEDGYLREALEPAKRVVRVTVREASDWSENPPVLTTTDAVQLAAQPFRVLLEDAVSDRNFLLKMATEDQRNAIVSRVHDGSLILEHGGGITSMLRRVNEICQNGPKERFTNWTIFDSDALRPNQASEQSERIRYRCIVGGIPHHQLRRRSIENYLPKNAMRAWAYQQKSQREARFLALMNLTDHQRFHYNFKEGFIGDANRSPPAAGDLYDSQPQHVKTTLGRGFGASVADLFGTHVVAEADLRQDGGWAEINGKITELIALLR